MIDSQQSRHRITANGCLRARLLGVSFCLILIVDARAQDSNPLPKSDTTTVVQFVTIDPSNQTTIEPKIEPTVQPIVPPTVQSIGVIHQAANGLLYSGGGIIVGLGLGLYLCVENDLNCLGGLVVGGLLGSVVGLEVGLITPYSTYKQPFNFPGMIAGEAMGIVLGYYVYRSKLEGGQSHTLGIWTEVLGVPLLGALGSRLPWLATSPKKVSLGIYAPNPDAIGLNATLHFGGESF